MRWQEVREMFPNQFVLVSILEYHHEGDKKFVNEVPPIGAVADKDAKEGTMVYHTANEQFIIHLRYEPLRFLKRKRNFVVN